MGVELGVNAGFIEEAPTEDPGGAGTTIDYSVRALKDVAPAGATKIVEIGWYCDDATEESDFDVALYSHDSGNDKPLNEVYSQLANAKGTDAGWKKVAVDWAIVEGVTYWMAVHLKNTATTTEIVYSNATVRYSTHTNVIAIPNPWWADSVEAETRVYAIYCVYEVGGGPPVGTNMKINISDVFKDVDSMKINVGDSWKDVIAVKQNVGDVWKDVFS
jgi:hypothetical protein